MWSSRAIWYQSPALGKGTQGSDITIAGMLKTALTQSDTRKIPHPTFAAGAAATTAVTATTAPGGARAAGATAATALAGAAAAAVRSSM